MIAKVQRLIKVGLAFGLSKSTVFFVPLLLSNFLSPADYGLFESCLAYGSLIAIILGCGLVAAVPYFMMVKKTESHNGWFYLHAAVLFIPLMVAIPLFAFKWIGSEIFLILTFAAVINWQRIYAADMKSRGNASYSSFSESFIYLAILVVALISLEKISIRQLSMDLVTIFIPMSLVLTMLMLRRYPIKIANWRSAREIYLFSLPTILPGMSLLLITSLVRLVAPFMVGAEKLAVYSFYFRFASIAVVVYQFLATIFFAEMYKRDAAGLDNIFTKVGLLILALAVSGFFVFPSVFSGVFKLFSTYKDYWVLYLVLVFFCYFWVCEAMLESIIFRQKLSKGFLWLQLGSLLIFCIVTGAIYVINKSLMNITTLAFLHTMLMAMVVMLQLRLLSMSGINLVWLRRCNWIVSLILLIGYPLVSFFS
ncbi:MAG: hypothetical protein Q7T36_06940 [Fluviicoccus sp.]|uniref:hypothetical protein n=1 Tax=Fluviicoccus sp. TaxID=2003552 RepID=UPI0027266437|nr:hypothetical protein [Fluviicoccus sp.]MDO8330189.1 hypothetical protein [Fluviicoccus sp.]